MPGLIGRKSIGLLLCLAYLVAGAGGAHAFIWCYQADGSIRAEFNPSGACESSCDAESAANERVGHTPDVFQDFSAEQCRDVPALQAQAKNISHFEPGGFLPAEPSHGQWQPDLIPLVEFQEQLLLAPQPPPPSPVLTALRTVFLLI